MLQVSNNTNGYSPSQRQDQTVCVCSSVAKLVLRWLVIGDSWWWLFRLWYVWL